MALSPDQLEAQEFKQSLFGSNKHEVTAFLKRVATDMRDLETKLATARSKAEEANRSKEAAIAAAAQMPVPPALSTASEIDADKFNELGDRIAGLLRSAEESAATITSSAEEEAVALKAEAEELLAQAQLDADQIRTEAEAEMAQLKTELTQARVSLDEELEETRKATAVDREEAKTALTTTKAEVGNLLAEARSQAEFIRHEADEIVRVKVRSDMETAEKRMRILQLTEQSSRDRLVSAQAELTTALEKLDADAVPELEVQDPEVVLGEAHDRATRALTSGGKASPFANSLDEVFEPQFYENPDAESDGSESDDSPESEADELSGASDIIETQESGSGTEVSGTEVSDSDHAETDIDDAIVDGDADVALDDDSALDSEVIDPEDVAETAEEIEVRELAELEAEIEALEAEEAASADIQTDSGESEILDVESETVTDEDLEVSGVVIEDSISTLPSDANSPLDSVEVPDDSGELMADAMAGSPEPANEADAIPAALSGMGSAPTTETKDKVLADEDPLAKLVREAMQRAVDSARGDD